MNKQQKEKQKELKVIYTECLKDVWGEDNKMVEYCLKTTNYIVELSDGNIIALEKPSIEKDFCFGYGYCGVSTEEDTNRAYDMVDVAKTNIEYFMNENLKQVQEHIDYIKNSKDKVFETIYIRPKYYSQSKDNKLKELYFHNPYHTSNSCLEECNEITKEDIKKVIEGYEIVKEEFTKRLNTYLKRYGLTKVNAWTYLVD